MVVQGIPIVAQANASSSLLVAYTPAATPVGTTYAVAQPDYQVAVTDPLPVAFTMAAELNASSITTGTLSTALLPSEVLLGASLDVGYGSGHTSSGYALDVSGSVNASRSVFGKGYPFAMIKQRQGGSASILGTAGTSSFPVTTTVFTQIGVLDGPVKVAPLWDRSFDRFLRG